MENLSLISLGCNKNLVDSEVMLGRLSKYKLIDEPQNSDVIIVNTCGFIASAKRESIQKILEVAMNKKDGAILVVSGCLSKRYTQELKEEIPEIDIIIGVGDYDKIDFLIQEYRTKRSLPSISDSVFLIDNHERIITGSNIQAYIKLSEGCNQRCSFCAIPNFKGKLHSRSIESCIKEIEILVRRGYKDFSFIAQDSSSYMMDMGRKDALIELISSVEQIDGVQSARILYLYPTSTNTKIIERIAESSVFQNYFDMPLQHISNNMLSLMKRGTNKERHLELLKAMRSCDNSFIRTTFLLGHPGETQRDFEELCEFVSDFTFDRINIFAYSKEENTKAYNMANPVSKEIVDERIDILNTIILKQQENLLKGYVSQNVIGILDGISKESDLLFSARDIRWDREIDGEILINENLDSHALSSGYYEINIHSYVEGRLIGRTLKRL